MRELTLAELELISGGTYSEEIVVVADGDGGDDWGDGGGDWGDDWYDGGGDYGDQGGGGGTAAAAPLITVRTSPAPTALPPMSALPSTTTPRAADMNMAPRSSTIPTEPTACTTIRSIPTIRPAASISRLRRMAPWPDLFTTTLITIPITGTTTSTAIRVPTTGHRRRARQPS